MQHSLLFIVFKICRGKWFMIFTINSHTCFHFFIAFRPFPGLPFILSCKMHKKRWNSWITVHCFLMSCRDDFNKSHSGIKQRPVKIFGAIVEKMTSIVGLNVEFHSVTKLANVVQQKSTSLTFWKKIIWYNTWKSIAWRASRTTRRKSTRKMWLHSIDFSVVSLFNKSFNSVNKSFEVCARYH